MWHGRIQIQNTPRSGSSTAPIVSEVSTTFLAGKLQYFLHERQKITNDPVILDMVQHCHLDINVSDVSHLCLCELAYKFNFAVQAVVNDGPQLKRP